MLMNSEQIIFREFRTDRFKAMELLDRGIELLESGTTKDNIFFKLNKLATPPEEEDIIFEIEQLTTRLSSKK